MKKYVGARWLGKYPLSGRPRSGVSIQPGEVTAYVPEHQAKNARGWEPVYEGEKRKEKADKSAKGDES